MTDIIFSFDTEDYTTPDGADCIVRESEIMRSEGVRGGYATVGFMVKALNEWNRADTIEAMKHHDIGCHSLSHSIHPTLNEYLDLEDYKEANEKFMAQETEACNLIKGLSGKDIIFAVPPGNQRSYAALYGYSKLGIQIYGDTLGRNAEGKNFFYCNMLQVCYDACLDDLHQVETDEDIKKMLDRIATKKHMVLYHHPQRAICEEFWDGVNYMRGNLVEFGKWNPCKRYTKEQTEAFYNKFRRFIQLIKSDDRFHISSYSEFYENLKKEPERIIKKSDVPALYEKLSKKLEPTSLCISDIFLACRAFLMGESEYKCGRVYGFLDTPYAVAEEITLAKNDVIEAITSVDPDYFIPHRFTLGGKKIGPADLLRAAMQIVMGKDEAVVTPGDSMPDISDYPTLSLESLKGGWISCESFEDNYISKRLRAQAWTLRFPTGEFFN